MCDAPVASGHNQLPRAALADRSIYGARRQRSHLARAHLGDSTALEKLGLTGAPPFPVFVRLADVASFLVEHHDVALQPDRPEHFHRFLDQALDGLHLGVPATFLREHVFAGNCMLLLDGLDEVPGDAMRQRIVALIQQVVLHGKQVGNRHLITCRTRAYQGNVQLAADVATLHLAPFEKEQVKEFVDSWARALFDVPADAPSDAHNLGEANAYRDDLLRAIGENPSGDTFTESPLMLTVLAVVHWNKRRLPEQRAELYAAAVDYLLESHR